MKTLSTYCLLAMLLLLAAPATQAAINCSIASAGFSADYSEVLSITQTSLTLNCSRLSSDPATSAYSIRPDNGLYNSGQQNRANLSTYYLSYEDYQDSTCTTPWPATGGSALTGTINFGAALNASVERSFWACIPATQNYVAGNYTDLVTMTLTYSDGTGNVDVTGTHSVNITTTNSCTINAAPGNINFSYTALSPAAVTANTTFSATCTLLGGYSIAIDPAGGVISGLNYSLLLNTGSSGGSNPKGSTGTGMQQTFYINGTMPANQAGACTGGNCNDSSTHTLTISF